MVNYNNSKIFKIFSPEANKCFIGNTTHTSIYYKFLRYKCDYRRWERNKEGFHLSYFEILQYSDAQIVLLENYYCNTKAELLLRMQYWMDKTKNCCVNQLKYVDDKTKEKNIQIYRGEKFSCGCGVTYTRCFASQHNKTKKHQKYYQEQLYLDKAAELFCKI